MQVSLPISGLLLHIQHFYIVPFLSHIHFSSVCDCLWPWEVPHFWL